MYHACSKKFTVGDYKCTTRVLDNNEKKMQIKNHLREEVQKLKIDVVSSASSSQSDEIQLNKKQKSTVSLLLGDDYFSQTSHAVGNDEVTYYMSLPPAQNDADPLAWWINHKNEMPNLIKIAADYLSVPSSSVASERMFSSAGRLLNKLRCSLSAKHIDQILFLNKNFK